MGTQVRNYKYVIENERPDLRAINIETQLQTFYVSSIPK